MLATLSMLYWLKAHGHPEEAEGGDMPEEKAPETSQRRQSLKQVKMDPEAFDALMAQDQDFRNEVRLGLATLADLKSELSTVRTKVDQAPSRVEWRVMGAAFGALGMAMLALLFFFAYAFVDKGGGNAAAAAKGAEQLMNVASPTNAQPPEGAP